VRRALNDARVRTIGFVALFGLTAYADTAAYAHAYPTLHSRILFADSFVHNKAIVLFYGKAYNVLTAGGYSAWRVGGTLSILAAIFGLLGAVRVLRAEEDGGRSELVLAGAVSRRMQFTCGLTATMTGALALGVAEFAGLRAGGLAAAGSAFLALSSVIAVPVFAGIGAVVCQLAPTRRMAIELGGGAVALAFLLRVLADTVGGAGWVSWLTPLGWAEQLRAFTGEQPVVLLLPLAATVGLIVLAQHLNTVRDIGTGLLTSHDTAAPRLRWLGSTTAQAFRLELTSLMWWIGGVSVFAFIIGLIAKTTASGGIPRRLQQELARFGTGGVSKPADYLGLVFVSFVLVVALFAVSQVAALRHEESDERLETLLSLPVSRRSWMSGRLVLAATAAAAISLCAGFLSWAGATSGGANVSLGGLLQAGANCLAIGILFIGIAALLFSLLPRRGTGIAYGLVVVAFLWQLVGALLDVPRWVRDLTPFAHLGFAPAQPFRASDLLVLAAIGLVSAGAGIRYFVRRDLVGA